MFLLIVLDANSYNRDECHNKIGFTSRCGEEGGF